MKYKKMINEINNMNFFDKKQVYNLYKKIYKNNNVRTFENMMSYLRSENIFIESDNQKYKKITKSIYKYNFDETENKIYKTLSKEYSKINFIVWNTKILNDFTLHYVMKNYIIVEVEKSLIDLFINLLKEKMSKKYTIITQDILNDNRNLYVNDENIIVIKPLRVKSPLDNIENKKIISIEKIMVDLYVDKLYLYYQGKELQTIYKNILDKYDVNLKRLLNYAKLRMNIEKYNEYLLLINNKN